MTDLCLGFDGEQAIGITPVAGRGEGRGMTMNRRLERSSAVRSMGWIAATVLGAVLVGCGGEAPPPAKPAANPAPTVEEPPAKGKGKRAPVDVSSRQERNKKRAAEAKPAP